MSSGSEDLQQAEPSGSPPHGEPEFLLIGKLRKPHGLRGEIRMEVWTEFPERLKGGRTVYVGSDYVPIKVRSVRSHDRFLLIAFHGINTPELAGTIRNKWVYVRADQVPSLSEGEYYHHQIVGLQVVSNEGQLLGVVASILETGTNDVLLIRPEKGQDILLPYIDEVILEVDLQGGLIKVHPLPGLLP
jgi:16S rRNA processing protein RimM